MLRGLSEKPLRMLGILVLLGLVVPPTLQRFTRATFRQFTAPAVYGYSHIRDLQTYWGLRSHSKRDLIEAGRDLARANAAYAVSNERLDALEAEIQRLEQLLLLPSEPAYRYEVARVAQRDFSAWWEQLIIRKGTAHGIREGQAVVYKDGVVGRVRSAELYLAVVEVVSSPGFRMAARIEGIDSPVTYQGAVNEPLQPPRGEVINVPPEAEIPAGASLRLVSSQLGGIFPAGLPIGGVTALSPGTDGYFQRGTVSLPRQLSELREVAVIVPIEAE